MQAVGLLAIAALLALCGSAAPAASPPAGALKSVAVEGTEFVATFTDGRVLRSPDLVGATLTIALDGRTQRVRIDGVERDPDAHVGTVWLHTFSSQGADGIWRNICDPGPDGRRQGFPIAGRVRSGDAGLDPAEPGVFDITCTGGARGKCVRFGYGPWPNPQSTIPPYDLYNACVRMVRADYAGDGKGTTRNGMLIDLYDRFNIQVPDRATSFEFEAGWTKDGAVCVRHVRVKENTSLALLDAAPTLHGLTGDICTEDFARAHGAVLFDRSPL
jgi:ADYC domain